ncbi:MAG: L,D-transpeptidase family protein [Bradymonadales bacterium]
MRKNVDYRIFLAFSLLLSFLLLACTNGQNGEESGAGLAKQGEDEAGVVDLARYAEYVQGLAQQLELKLEPLLKQEEDENFDLSLKSSKKLRYPALIAKLYADFAPIFLAENGEFSLFGKSLLDALERIDEHAQAAELWPLAELRTEQERLVKLLEDLEERPGIWLNHAEQHALTQQLSAAGFDFSPQSELAMLKELVSSPQTSVVPRFAAAFTLWREKREVKTLLLQSVEFAMADAYLLYAKTLKYGNLDKFSAQEWEEFTTEANRNEIHPKHFDAIISARLEADFVSLRQSDPEKSAETLALLAPQHEQYAKLQALRERYRAIVESGDWDEIVGEPMNRNGRAPKVLQLKQRLQREGYFNGTMDDFYDEALVNAVRAYQETHQLELTGLPHDVFWRSLNVKASVRLAEIEANIRRWTHSMYENSERYIYVNVPSFTAELWDKGELLASHKIVVGNSTRFCNTRTRRWERMNATPLMHARMTYVVYSPYWNVPPRIEVDEYQKRMAQDPTWLEKSDFEYYSPRSGGRVLRQKPGPNNALGNVKLIFPNKHNTYFHDTPKKEMFTYPIRAFSHGCLRVEDAMDFAKLLLTLDGSYDQHVVDRAFIDKGEYPVDLNTPIDVFIDYHTVSVDAQGRGHFLADVYRYIRDEINPPAPADLQCDPARDKISEFRAAPVDDSGP